ncbi:MAG: hypothetical protein JO197_23910 [Acidobacteria bacterium]|nr:hypothetical protein [Acidobacteriota bacterium]MBV9476924.1 hypothetical protein [Acidobacteriota bacterium]
MSENPCIEASNAAYQARIGKLFDNLAECLMLAEPDNDEARAACQERFRRGLSAAREARAIALKECR